MTAVVGLARPRPVIAGSLGVLGGTFDPIHHGHLAIAEEAREALGLERVLFVPARVPPHKPGRPVTPAEDRLAMVALAVGGNPAFAVSRIELDRDGPSYTADTLAALDAERRREAERPATNVRSSPCPPPELVFILSAEAFGQLPTWHEPRRVVELARLAVVPRPGHAFPSAAWLHEHLAGLEDRVTFLDGPHLGLSGSEVRARAAAGRSIRYLVPDAVARYIAEHHLYRTDSWRHERP